MMQPSHELNEKQFREISDLVYRHCGINLKDGKEALVKARLMKRFRAIGMDSVESYLELIQSKAGDHELDHMIDAMTTNKTSFFREIEHFKFLREMVLPQFKGRRMRCWSAACSSGEEPYSLAMLLREHLSDIDRRDVLILATDISRRMLEKGAKALYPEEYFKGSSIIVSAKIFCQIAKYRMHLPDFRYCPVHGSSGPPESDGFMADERAVSCDFLPQCDDLF